MSRARLVLVLLCLAMIPVSVVWAVIDGFYASAAVYAAFFFAAACAAATP